MPTLLEFFQNQKSSKINCSSRDLSLSEGCDIAMCMNNLVSELLFHDGKQLNIIAYTDKQSLYDVAHTLK